MTKIEATRLAGDLRHFAQEFGRRLEQLQYTINAGAIDNAMICCDESIDGWNRLIDKAPGALKKIKLNYLIPAQDAALAAKPKA